MGSDTSIFQPAAGQMHNMVLAQLPETQRAIWNQRLELVRLRSGTCLYEPGELVTRVVLPIDAVVAMIGTASAGETALVGTVGYDGLVGLPALMNSRASIRAVVQIGGRALQMDAAVARASFHDCRETRMVLLRYMQAYIAQLGQIALCNRYHRADQQLCTLLLRTLDRTQGTSLDMTHELLAGLLGWRRETVSQAAHRLQLKGVLHYRRGLIHLVDREELARLACECYACLEATYAQVWFAPSFPSGR